MNKGVVNKSMLVAAGILVAASMAFARFPSLDLGHSTKKSADVEIEEPARIPGGPTLHPGEYKVVLNDKSSTPEIGFYQDGKLVAQAPAKLVDQGKKFGETKVYYDTKGTDTYVMTQMDLSGWREKILFGTHNGNATSMK